jgi:hypothetical protein
MSQPLIDSLRRALAANPDDLPLRLHLAELLLDAGDRSGAVSELATVLASEPANPAARGLMGRALAGEASEPTPTGSAEAATRPAAATNHSAEATEAAEPTAEQPSESRTGPPTAPVSFDWTAAEEQLGVDLPPTFVQSTGSAGEPAFDLERPQLTLADVGGMTQAKQRLEASFLAPLRNPELRRMYRKSLHGGLLLYGPPGCGKTYLARALAGELQAGFLSVQITDVLDPYIGSSERNVREMFLTARRAAPCVLFFDEVDALGQRRSQVRGSALRGTINQLLTELDGVEQDNDGVFVLAATNQPWDVDPALRRPGRRSSGTTWRTGRSPVSIPVGWPSAPMGYPARTSPTPASWPPSTRCWTASPPGSPGRSACRIWTRRWPASSRRSGRGWRPRATWSPSARTTAPTPSCASI